MCYRYTTGQSVREDSSRCWPAVALRSERGRRPTQDHSTRFRTGTCVPAIGVSRAASVERVGPKTIPAQSGRGRLSRSRTTLAAAGGVWPVPAPQVVAGGFLSWEGRGV